MTCACGAPTDAPCGVCDDCIAVMARDTAAAQGLPPVVTDERTLRLLSRIVRTELPQEAA